MTTAFLLLGAVVLENFLVAVALPTHNMARQMDLWFAIAFTSFWSVLHLFICLATWCGLFYAKWEVVTKQDNEGRQSLPQPVWVV